MEFSGFFFLSTNILDLGEMNMKQLFKTIINKPFA